MDKFEEAFEKLKKDGKTSVDDIIAWMKETKLIPDKKEAEEKARTLFSDVTDAKDVQVEKFKEAVEKLAKEQKKTVEEFTKNLAEQGTRLATALVAGASAFKDAFSKK